MCKDQSAWKSNDDRNQLNNEIMPIYTRKISIFSGIVAFLVLVGILMPGSIQFNGKIAIARSGDRWVKVNPPAEDVWVKVTPSPAHERVYEPTHDWDHDWGYEPRHDWGYEPVYDPGFYRSTPVREAYAAEVPSYSNTQYSGAIQSGTLSGSCVNGAVVLHWSSGANANSNSIQKGDFYPHDPNRFWEFIQQDHSLSMRTYTDFNINPGIAYTYRIKYAPAVPSNVITVTCPVPTPYPVATPYPTPTPAPVLIVDHYEAIPQPIYVSTLQKVSGVQTGAAGTALMALLLSGLLTFGYMAYTRTNIFVRRDAAAAVKRSLGDKQRFNFARFL